MGTITQLEDVKPVPGQLVKMNEVVVIHLTTSSVVVISDVIATLSIVGNLLTVVILRRQAAILGKGHQQ